METPREARDEASRRKWPWVIFNPENWQWGYAKSMSVQGGENCIHFSVNLSVDYMKIAAFDHMRKHHHRSRNEQSE